jgi:hypothetical protein
LSNFKAASIKTYFKSNGELMGSYTNNALRETWLWWAIPTILYKVSQSKIQNPTRLSQSKIQNPKSYQTFTIQNPKSYQAFTIQNPKSKILPDFHNPKSKILPGFHNPKSKIQNPMGDIL